MVRFKHGIFTVLHKCDYTAHRPNWQEANIPGDLLGADEKTCDVPAMDDGPIQGCPQMICFHI